MRVLVASEAVGIGHPDKVADQISDAILDAYLAQDPHARVDATCVLSHDTLFLAGEITSHAHVDVVGVAKAVLYDIGYTSAESGFNAATCKTVVQICQQSTDIKDALYTTGTLGAGDQGIMIGYACSETAEYMPLGQVLANKLMQALHAEKPIFGPDGKTLVGISYDGITPQNIEFIVLSCQHPELMAQNEVQRRLKALIMQTVPSKLLTSKTTLLVNPGGKFVIAGPSADTGLTGRKLAVDTYGPSAHHGGGAFSGKDPSKVDRSASYAARYIAKNIVAAKLASRCEVSLCYAIGKPEPLAVTVQTFGTSSISNSQLEAVIPKVFRLDVAGIISMLQLERPIYRKTAWGGHFGRSDPDFTWEATDKVQEILSNF